MQIEIITRNQISLMIEEALMKQNKELNKQLERMRKILIEKPFKFKNPNGNKK